MGSKLQQRRAHCYARCSPNTCPSSCVSSSQRTPLAKAGPAYSRGSTATLRRSSTRSTWSRPSQIRAYISAERSNRNREQRRRLTARGSGRSQVSRMAIWQRCVLARDLHQIRPFTFLVIQIKSKNHIDFAIEYLRHCSHVSVMLRDSQSGETVGWCLMHEDGSLASLFVKPSYRGSRASQVQRPAALIEETIARLIIEAQRTALENLLGTEPGPRIVTAWTERQNQAGVRFFESSGYKAADAGGSWIGLVYRDNN